MKIRIFLISLLYISSAGAEPFSDLKKERIDSFEYKKLLEMNVHYNPELFTKIGKTRKDFPEEHPLYTDEFGGDDMVLGIFDLTGAGHKYYVVYSSGPSLDVNYCFYKEDRVAQALEKKEAYINCDDEIYALSIVIPGNGNVYSYGHMNSMYDQRLKFRVNNGKLSLVPQPFLYVGKKTISVKGQIVYTDETLKEESFRITDGYEVTVVGIKHKSQNAAGTGELYLVASEFGLVGWVKSERLQTESQFEGFYFSGD